jgi:hypothetical protein
MQEQTTLNIFGIVFFVLIILSLMNVSRCKSYRSSEISGYKKCRCIGSRCTCGVRGEGYTEKFKKSRSSFGRK